MLRRPVVTAAFLGLAFVALAKYSLDVQKSSDFPSGVKALAVLPASCPSNVNAVWVDEKIESHLKRCKLFKIIPSSTVKQAMFDMQIRQVNDSNRKELADKLKADAFLVVVIGHSSSEPEGVAVGYYGGGVMTMGGFSIAKGGVDILVVLAKDGKVILQGKGFGETDWKSEKGVLAKVLDKLFDKALK